MPPGQRAVLGMRPEHRVEQPGPDDLVGLGPQVHREHAAEQVIVRAPAAGDLRGQRGRRPGVHHVRVAGEPAGPAALLRGVAGRHVGGRIDRQRGVRGQDRRVVPRLAGLVQRVPDRDRHPEVPLPADQPVAGQPVDPVLVPRAHVRRVPGKLPPAAEQRGAQAGVPAAVPDVPLPGGHDLQRQLAPLVELHRVLGRLGIAAQLASVGQQAGHPLPGLPGRRAGQPGVGGPARRAVDPRWRVGQQPAVAADHRPGRQPQLPPPGHVGGVAERAHHRDAGALARLGQPVREDRHLHAEHRRADGAADQAGVPLVVGMRDQRHASGQQLGPGGGDQHLAAALARGALISRAAGDGKGQPVIRGRDRPVLDFSLRDRGAEGDVPQGRGLGEVSLVPGEVAEEAALSHGPGPLVDRAVLGAPVDGQAEMPPGLLVGLLVQLGQLLAQRHEVAPGDRDLPVVPGGRRCLRPLACPGRGGRLEGRVIRQRRVTPDAEVVLHPALGRQPVVVPADRVEHFLAAHPLEPRDRVRVGEREDVPDVQRPADRQRGSVDGVDAIAAPGAVKLVLHEPLPTGATTSPRCRQAWAWPARRWRGSQGSCAQS